ncbi:MAG: dTDP-glucose 4,6-dehydratase [Chloroflexi bacterium]|nr:dTDP-glucose 4,6-dehydratase [Chloroflexota bacterium]
MRNMLVTGGAGFIGSNFIRHALVYTHINKLVNLDLLTYAGSLSNLAGLETDPRYQFVQADIRSRELVQNLLLEHQIDTLVHFAAETHVDRSIRQPEIFIESNVLGTFQLLEAARQAWDGSFSGKRFHHVSTDEVYGTLAAGEPSFSETTPYNPRSPYSASKAGSDHCVRAYFHTYGLPVTISNCSNNYGPYQYPEKFIPVIILNCLMGEIIPVYGDGRQIRDWIYVEDHCRGILRILEDGQPGETYNLGGGNQPSNLEVLEQICAIMDRKRPGSPHVPHHNLLRFVIDRPGHDRRYAMDCRKINAALGWQPEENLASGLEKTVDWYLDHMDWLLAVARDEKYRTWIQTQYKEES